jgi:Ca-activated chloride channel homolog
LSILTGKRLEGIRLVTPTAAREIAVALAVGLSVSPAVAGRAAQAPQEPQATFKAAVEVVTVSTTVRDGRGRTVKNLKRSDFEVMDAGAPREIKDFHAGESAISLALLLDISGSMAVGGNMDRARQAIAVGLQQLTTGRDEAALYTFDAELQEVRAFTTDIQRVKAVNLAGRPWGLTSLFDAVAASAEQVAERTNRHRALVVITDGIDTGSRMTPGEVSGLASSIDVPVYLVVVANPVDNPEHELAILEADGASTRVGTLADLARWTGGDMSLVSGTADSIQALGALVRELRHQYLITFEPGTSPGWHPLEIRTRKKNLIVHARSGYIAGPGRSEANRD